MDPQPSDLAKQIAVDYEYLREKVGFDAIELVKIIYGKKAATKVKDAEVSQ